MALILPLISFLIGYWGAEKLKSFRALLASLLARLLIPVVIIYNMVFYKEGSLWLIAFSFFSSIFFFAIFYVDDAYLTSRDAEFLQRALDIAGGVRSRRLYGRP